MSETEITASFDALAQFAPTMTTLIEGNIEAFIYIMGAVASFALIIYLFDFLAELARD